MQRHSTNPVFNDRKLKLGTFGTNLDRGCAISTIDGVLEINWPNTLELAKISEAMEFEALVPIGRWHGFGGVTNFNGPGFEPTGEPLFATGASSNSGSYSNTNEDKLIEETHTSSSISAFDSYATYTAQQLPFIWMPDFYTVQAVSNKLANVEFNPLFTQLPEYWNFTK